MLKTLNEFKIGESGIVSKVEGNSLIKRRLMDMGITRGAKVLLRKKAPLGDPLEISIRGYELTLRTNEAIYVTMEVNDD